MTNLKVLDLSGIDLKYNVSLPMKLKSLHHLEDLSLKIHSSDPASAESHLQGFCDILGENLPSNIKRLTLVGKFKFIDATKLFSHLTSLAHLESFAFKVGTEKIIRTCFQESGSYYWKSLKSLDLGDRYERDNMDYSSCFSVLAYLNAAIIEEIKVCGVKLNQVLEFEALFDILLNFTRLKTVEIEFIVQQKIELTKDQVMAALKESKLMKKEDLRLTVRVKEGKCPFLFYHSQYNE